jgi:IS30 family transposase
MNALAMPIYSDPADEERDRITDLKKKDLGVSALAQAFGRSRAQIRRELRRDVQR